jgi:cytochrome c oxidase subunit 1
MGWDTANFVASIGAITLGVGVFIYFSVMVYTYFKGERVKSDYWDGRTLEWSIPNPPPEYNFRVIPTVHARDAWWYEKHHRDEIEKEKAEHAKDEDSHGGIHMPFSSIWPLVASFGLLVAAIGISALDANNAPGHTRLAVVLAGGFVMFLGIYFWSLEGNEGYHLHLDKDGNPIEDDSAHH